MTPPTVLQDFPSIKDTMGHYVSMNCSINGNPMPKIEWYRNGELLRFGPTINYEENRLIIYTFEEEHKGVYQCIGTNDVGEAQATGLLSWETRTYIKRPENVKCYPINYSTMKVTFDTESKVSEHEKKKFE